MPYEEGNLKDTRLNVNITLSSGYQLKVHIHMLCQFLMRSATEVTEKWLVDEWVYKSGVRFPCVVRFRILKQLG